MSPTTTEHSDLQQQPPSEQPPATTSHDPEAQPPADDRRSLLKRHRAAKPIVFLIVILALLVVGWFWWESRHWESTDDAEIDGHIYPISARVTGHVIKVNYDDGQFVHKGDVLVLLDPTDYQVALERAQAEYADSQASAQAAEFGVPISSVGSTEQIRSAQADMQNAEAGLSAAQKQVAAARAQVVEAQANAKKLNADVVRYQQLLGKREISQQQFDSATAAATGANATVEARQAHCSRRRRRCSRRDRALRRRTPRFAMRKSLPSR